MKRLVPAGLILLSALPLTFGALRLAQLAGVPTAMPANAEFFASPVPLVVHIVGAFVFAVLGALQFAPGFRRRRPGWHRVAGRFVGVAGLLVGLSGLWLTLFYTRPHGSGPVLYALRLVFSSAMVASIVLGLAAIRRRDLMGHRAWMLRGYAIGMGAATQMLTLMVGEMVAGKPGVLGHDLLMGAGWAINIAVAEWAIRRHRRPALPVRAAPAGAARPVAAWYALGARHEPSARVA
jgi:uncharacterized membrane protein YozB (DUF420 family)